VPPGPSRAASGFTPLLAYLDESREALAGVLRPGNAGANTASDHVEIVDLALEQLPCDVIESAEIVIRTDSAAATHEFTDELRAARIGFLMGAESLLRRTVPRPRVPGGATASRTIRPSTVAWLLPFLGEAVAGPIHIRPGARRLRRQLLFLPFPETRSRAAWR
jgi:Transposase DDE domain group 1